jgi:hypothetical protein
VSSLVSIAGRLLPPGLALSLLAALVPSAPAAPAPKDSLSALARAVVREAEVADVALGSPAPLRWPDFTAKAMKPYRLTAGDTPLRKATLKARNLLNAEVRGLELRAEVREADLTESGKAALLEHQRAVARSLTALSDGLEALMAAGRAADREPSRRWRVHYHYVRGRLLAHIAFLYEYQSALGQMRKQPPRLAEGDDGWRLEPVKKMQGDEMGKKVARMARNALEGVADDHPGTPWQYLARRALRAPQGLTWRSAKLK